MDELAPHLRPAHRRALGAAARVACLATVLGCGPKNTTTEAPATAPATPAATQPQADGELPAEVQACYDTVDAALAATTDPGALRKASDEVKGCCETIVANFDMMTADFRLRSECCDALNWPGGACTPWGPPTPPRFTGVA